MISQYILGFVNDEGPGAINNVNWNSARERSQGGKFKIRARMGVIEYGLDLLLFMINESQVMEINMSPSLNLLSLIASDHIFESIISLARGSVMNSCLCHG